ncbi:MAG: hypothetical protein ABJP33_15180 [Pseudoruegeria sp.]
MMATENRLAKALKNLGLALLNATLMLVLLCLVFAWLAMKQMNAFSGTISQSFADGLVQVEPVKEQLSTLNSGIVSLRSDLQEIRTTSGTVRDVKIENVQQRLDIMAAITAEMRAKLQGIVQNPDLIVDRVVTTAVGELTGSLVALRGCHPDLGANLNLLPAS